MKKILAGLLFSLWSTLASAGVNCTMPFTFVPGTLADANQVNANYAAVVACLLNAAAAGNNNDITALLALTTPITPAAGGSVFYVGGTSTGTANAQVVATPIPTGFALTRGNSVIFIAGFTNTGALQLNVAGTGLTNAFRATPSGPQAMTGGEVITNNLVVATYDGTQYQIVSNGPQFGGFGPLVSLASATTTDLGTVPTHNVNITGVTTITGLGSTASATYPVYNLTFSGVLTLTYNATSLILPSTTNITTAANDTATALYLGSGNWQIMDYRKATGTSVVSPTPLCGFSGLTIANNTGTPNTSIDVAWNQSVLLNPTGNIPLFSTAQSFTINTTTGVSGTSTANGMDGTARGNNNIISLWGISNGTIWAGVASSITSYPTAPTLPAGYTYVCYLGSMKTNGSSNFYGTQQSGPEVRYISGGNGLTSYPQILSGAQGTNCTTATPTFAAAQTVRGSTGTGIWLPPSATMGDFIMTSGSGGTAILATNANTAGLSGSPATNPSVVGSVTGVGTALPVRIKMEASTIFVCQTAAAASWVYGWKDAVNAN